jgi:probable O-glycosylation ligase (exosortase A-associated)
MKGLVFTYLMTYGGAAASLFSPYIGLLIYVCFAIIKPEVLWAWSVPPGNYSRIVAVGLLAGWALQGLGRWQFGRGGSIVALFLSYWAWSVLAMTAAPNQEVAWRFVELLTKIVLPFLVGVTTIDSVRKLKNLAWVIVLSQGYLAYDFNMSYLGGFNRLQVAGFGPLDNNSMAIALVACTGLALFLALTSERWWTRALAAGTALAMMHAILISFSRGGMLGLIVTAFVAFLLLPKRPLYIALFAACVFLGLQLAGEEVRKRFATSFAEEGERDASAQSRVDLWKGCVDVMMANPVTGIGPDHWPLVAKDYGWPAGKEAHTLWLQIGAELGVPGLALLFAFYGLCVVKLWPLAHEKVPLADPWLGGSSRMVIASLAGFMVSAQFVSLEALEIPYYTVMIGVVTLKLNSVDVLTN